MPKVASPPKDTIGDLRQLPSKIHSERPAIQNKIRGPSPQISPFMMPPGPSRISNPGQLPVRSFTPGVMPESHMFESTPSFGNKLVDNRPKHKISPAPRVEHIPSQKPAVPPIIEQREAPKVENSSSV